MTAPNNFNTLDELRDAMAEYLCDFDGGTWADQSEFGRNVYRKHADEFIAMADSYNDAQKEKRRISWHSCLEAVREPQLAEEARAGRLDPEQWRATQ